jgi:hypothetical protein
MINKNELRFGNWVIFNDDTDRYGQVSEIHEFYPVIRCDYIPDHHENRIKECLIDYEFIHGILLTKKTLEQAGFELGPCKKSIFFKNRLKLWLGHNGCIAYWKHEDRDESFWIGDCKYLHQLQNLYFSLTGEELEITL